MGAGVFNVVVGAALVISGLRGAVLPLTTSSEALMGVGGAIAALGIYQIVTSRRR